MRVLVTGGTGYLGSAIVRALERHGHHAVVFARRARASGLPGTLVDGDVRDRAAVERAARGADAICHMAALVSMWSARRQDFHEINVGGLQTVLNVCAAQRIPRVVYTSSFLALPPADASAPLSANEYQRTKVEARAVAAEAATRGMPVVTLFPGVVYGPGVATEGNLIGRLVRDHLAGRLPGLIGAERSWSYAFVDDVADGHLAALAAERPASEYVLGGENAPQMRVFEVVRDLTGTALPRRIPFPLAEALAMMEETRSKLLRRAPLLTRGVVEIFRHDWSLDSARSIAELGYRITPLPHGLRAVIQHLRALS